MKDGRFKTRAEIWKHLIEGGRVEVENIGGYFFLKDGEVYHSNGYRGTSDFKRLENWSIYEESKPKKKVTLYNYLYEDGGNLWESGFTSKEFNSISFLKEVKLIKTESKEVEYDDV